MTITEFIEKAIEGGWGKDFFYRGEITSCKKEAGKIYLEWYSGETESLHLYEESKECVLLDPLAWQAVGKVEGWGTEPVCNDCGNIRPERYDLSCSPNKDCNLTSYEWTDLWLRNMHRMIDALAGGKTIEQYLKTL